MRKESVEALLSRTQRETLRHPTLDQPDTLLVTNDKMHAALTMDDAMESLVTSRSSHSLLTHRSLRTFRAQDSETDKGNCLESLVMTTRTMRSLLAEIEDRAESDDAPPRFVSPLEALPPAMLTWNARRMRASASRINIIDSRSRKHKKAIDKAKQFKHEQQTHTNRKIVVKKDRKLELTTQMSVNKQAKLFCKVVMLVHITQILNKKYMQDRTIRQWIAHINNMASRIARVFRLWTGRTIECRRSEIKRVVARNAWRIVLKFHIRQKRQAVSKLVNFLQACIGHQAFNIVVSRYLKSIRKLQQVTRAWIACKKSRILILEKIWIQIERKYILKMLRHRMHRRVSLSTGAQAQHLFNELNLNQKTRLELEKQDLLWADIDSQVVAKLVSHRKSRGETNISLNDAQVKSMELSPEDRYVVLKNLLERKRSQFVRTASLQSRYQLAPVHIAQFDINDAKDLIHNRPVKVNLEKEMARIQRENRKRILSKESHFFPMLKVITHKTVSEAIHEEHDRLKTFEVKFDKTDYVKVGAHHHIGSKQLDRHASNS